MKQWFLRGLEGIVSTCICECSEFLQANITLISAPTLGAPKPPFCQLREAEKRQKMYLRMQLQG